MNTQTNPPNTMYWLPIAQADKKARCLVNDTTVSGFSPVFAYYHEGWWYEDFDLSEANPTGPQPTHFLRIPPLT